MHHLQSGLMGEDGRREMGQGAHACGAIIEPVGLALGQSDEFLRGLGGEGGVDGDELRRLHQGGHMGEVLHHIQRHLLLHEGADDEAAGDGDAQRIAVGLGAGDGAHGGGARSARPVFHHGLLAHLAGDEVGHVARHFIHNAAGGEADHEAHGFGGIGLRQRRAATQRQGRRQSGCPPAKLHRIVPSPKRPAGHSATFFIFTPI